MRILAAPNAFKGSLSVLDAAKAMKRGILQACPQAEVALFPISDGGDGLMDAFLWSEGGREKSVWVKGPLGERRRAAFAILPSGEAVVEMARASGLALVKPPSRNPLLTTSWGTGDLIAAAARAKLKTVIVGLGGSASSDGGAGMAQALGARLLDAKGRELKPGAGELRRLARIDVGGFLRAARAIKVIAVSDVDNPLLGPRGSARIFGPQKGATPKMVEVLEQALARYAAVMKKDLGLDVAKVCGGGAAGGLGAGLIAFLGADIVPGAGWVLKRLGASKALSHSDGVITGEGWLDSTSFYGKAPIELSRLAARRKIPCALVCGQIEEKARRKAQGLGVKAAVSFAQAGARPQDSMLKARHWAAKAARLAAQGLMAALCLGVAPGLSRAAALNKTPTIDARVDWLYFHRDQDDNLNKDLSLLNQLLLLRPRNEALLWRRGRALVRAGENEKNRGEKIKIFRRAMESLKAAVVLNPRDPDAHFWYGVSMGRLGQARGILHSLFLVGPIKNQIRTILALDPDYSGAYRMLGEMDLHIPRFAGGNATRGIAEIVKSLELAPSDTSGYIALAKAYESVGEKAKAVAALRAALNVAVPDDPAESQDDRKDARAMLQKLQAAPR